MKRFRFQAILMVFSLLGSTGTRAQTEVTTWQFGKTGAVSLTYDDGISTQFSQALPLMLQWKLPATFFVITGPIKGSNYPATFIGRPVKEIIEETSRIPTRAGNFFERASALRYTGYKGTLPYYDRIDERYESSRVEEAYQLTDSIYGKIRSGSLLPGIDTSMEIANETGLSWSDLGRYATLGFEIASHTVTHAHLAIMDTANMLYELQKSQQEIRDHLGGRYTFSAEVPFGIEDPRVMKTALPVYAALRNRMPEPYLSEINRGDPAQPGKQVDPYVQWQRGPLSKTSLEKMESWVDTTLAHKNIWLVLVFHGIDEVGWEPLPSSLLATYLQYLKKQEPKLWIATFGDVTRYMRERMDTRLQIRSDSVHIQIRLHHSLDARIYAIPLTLKTYVPGNWKKVEISRTGNNGKTSVSVPLEDNAGKYVLYQVAPDIISVSLQELK